MNIAEAFAQHLEDITSLSLGQEIWIGEAPSTNKISTPIYWIVSIGGSPERMITRETTKLYSLNVYYRSTDYKSVYNTLQWLEDQLNCSECTQLEGYDTIEVQAAIVSVDDDLDLEDRKVGLLQVNITINDDCEV